MKLYNSKQIDKLIERYLEKNGEVIQIDEGVLTSGSFILHGYNLKTAIIKEVFINEWSSLQSVRFYNSTPKKYQKIISVH